MKPRVLITRPRDGAGQLRRLLEKHGIEVLELPTIAIRPPEDPAELYEVLRHLVSYDWMVFTSQSAVSVVEAAMRELGVSFPSTLRVAAVGPRTAAALAEMGASVSCIPDEASGQALARALQCFGLEGARVLVPAGDRARPEFPQALRAAGAEVRVIITYRTTEPSELTDEMRESLRVLRGGGVQAVALASPSALHGLLSLLGSDTSSLRHVRLVCIGPTTASTIRQAGFEPAAIAEPHTVGGLAEAITTLILPETARDPA